MSNIDDKDFEFVEKEESNVRMTNTDASLEARYNVFKKMCIENGLSEEFVHKAVERGFLIAPASTGFHGAHEGGLFDHSNEVYHSLRELTEKLGLVWQRPESVFIVGMLHDYCKTVQYHFDPIEHAFRWKNQCIPGHAQKSISLLCVDGVTLTEEEMLCITHHMGAYETDDWKEFDAAIKKYPNVLYTHTADMIASKIIGI